jgi:hypothetical protein
MIAVRILRGFGLWNAGEVAGFHADRAQALIADGFAELHEKPEAKAKSKADQKAESKAEG